MCCHGRRQRKRHRPLMSRRSASASMPSQTVVVLHLSTHRLLPGVHRSCVQPLVWLAAVTAAAAACLRAASAWRQRWLDACRLYSVPCPNLTGLHAVVAAIAAPSHPPETEAAPLASDPAAAAAQHAVTIADGAQLVVPPCLRAPAIANPVSDARHRYYHHGRAPLLRRRRRHVVAAA